MKRELKFRIWDTVCKTMIQPDQAHIRMYATGSISVDQMWVTGDVIPLQFTGLKDSTGADIYESDIVKFRSGGIEYQRPVVWNPIGMWSIQWGDSINPGPMRGEYTVIGNIYENSELLK